MRATPRTDPALAALAERDPRYAELFARLDAEEAESEADSKGRPSVSEALAVFRRIRACPHFSADCPCRWGTCSRPESPGPKTYQECYACRQSNP